jgi:hypothetical protein
MLSRQDRFRADEERRRILGIDSNNALAGLQGDALMLGHIAVRVLDGPEWYKNSRGLLELPDSNIIGIIFAKCCEKEDERKKDMMKKSEDALSAMKAETKQ